MADDAASACAVPVAFVNNIIAYMIMVVAGPEHFL